MELQRPGSSRFVLLATTLGSAALRRATPVAAPLYLSIAVVAAVLFGPSRLSSADACAAAIDSMGIRAGLWIGWLLISLPVVRSLLVVPDTHWLRALPLPSCWMWLVHTGLVVAAQAPWIVLWGSGRGLTTGIAYGVAAAAAQVLLLIPTIAVSRVLLLAVTVTAPIALVPPPVLLCGALVVLLLGARDAWARAPEGRSRGGSVLALFRGPRWAALPATYLVDLWRGHSSRLVRALLTSLTGSAAIWLVIRNNQLEEPSQRVKAAMIVCCPTLAMSLTGIASRCLAVERENQWLLDITSIRVSHRIVGLCITVSLLGFLLGAVIGAVVTLSLRPGLGLGASIRLLGVTSLWSATVGLLLALALRFGQNGSQAGSGREVGSVLIVLLGTTVSAAVWADASILLVFTAAPLLFALVTHFHPRLPAG